MMLKTAEHAETISQQIKRSFVIYRKTMPYVLWLSLAISIISSVPRLWIVITGHDLFQSTDLFSLHRLWFFGLEIAGMLFFTAMLWRIKCLMKSLTESYQIDLTIALQKLPKIVAAALLQGVFLLLITLPTVALLTYSQQHHLNLANHTESIFFIALPFVFQIFGTVYLLFLFYFYLPLILAENQSILMSLWKSAKLVWGNWWRTFSVQVFPWISYLLILAIIRIFARVDVGIYFINIGYHALLLTILHILLFAMFVPWVASTVLVQLRDLELRQRHVG